MMDCRRVNDALSPLLDGALPAKERIQVEAHLRACAACRTEYEKLRQMDALYGGLDRLEAPADMEDRVRRSVAARPVRLRRRIVPRSTWPLYAAAAALIVTTVFAYRLLLVSPDNFRLASIEKTSESPVGMAPSPASPPRGTDNKTLLESADQTGFSAADEAPEVAAPQAEPSAAPTVEAESLLGGTSEKDATPETDTVMDSMRVPALKRDAAPEPVSPRADAHSYSKPAQDAPGEAIEDREEESTAPVESDNRRRSALDLPQSPLMRDIAGHPEDDMKARQPAPGSAAVDQKRLWAKRSFVRQNGRWVEHGYTDEETTEVRPGTQKVRDLLRKDPGIEAIFTQSDPIVFQIDNAWYLWCPD